jgi:hypothetical protein
MSRNLQRRLAQLEKKQAGPLRRRYVWWNKGEPKPQAKPGEELMIFRWKWDSDEAAESPSTSAQDTCLSQ